MPQAVATVESAKASRQQEKRGALSMRSSLADGAPRNNYSSCLCSKLIKAPKKPRSDLTRSPPLWPPRPDVALAAILEAFWTGWRDRATPCRAQPPLQKRTSSPGPTLKSRGTAPRARSLGKVLAKRIPHQSLLDFPRGARLSPAKQRQPRRTSSHRLCLGDSTLQMARKRDIPRCSALCEEVRGAPLWGALPLGQSERAPKSRPIGVVWTYGGRQGLR